MGILLALAISFAIYFWLKKKYTKVKFLRPFNQGIFTFSIITAILGIIIYFSFFALFQNLVS